MADAPCTTCGGQGCEEGCGQCEHANVGPDSHKVCTTCHGAGVVARTYELADFDPVDGHLHSCHVPGQVAANNERVEPCDCAAHLFAIAQDEALRTEQVGWVRDDGDEYHDFRYASHVDRMPGIVSSIEAGGYLPVFVRTQGPSDG